MGVRGRPRDRAPGSLAEGREHGTPPQGCQESPEVPGEKQWGGIVCLESLENTWVFYLFI